jgi:hypothetical protein
MDAVGPGSFNDGQAFNSSLHQRSIFPMLIKLLRPAANFR